MPPPLENLRSNRSLVRKTAPFITGCLHCKRPCVMPHLHERAGACLGGVQASVYFASVRARVCAYTLSSLVIESMGGSDKNDTTEHDTLCEFCVSSETEREGGGSYKFTRHSKRLTHGE